MPVPGATGEIDFTWKNMERELEINSNLRYISDAITRKIKSGCWTWEKKNLTKPIRMLKNLF